MFPTLIFDENQSLQQLVILYKDLLKKEDNKDLIERECKRAIIRVATFQGIIRSQYSTLPDKQEWYNEYMSV
jgi:hypothetical protein